MSDKLIFFCVNCSTLFGLIFKIGTICTLLFCHFLRSPCVFFSLMRTEDFGSGTYRGQGIWQNSFYWSVLVMKIACSSGRFHYFIYSLSVHCVPTGWDLTPVVLTLLLKCGSAVLSDSFSPVKHFSFKYLTLEPSKEQVGEGGVSLDGIYDWEKYRCRWPHSSS